MDEYLHLLTNASHWLFGLTEEIATSILVSPLVAKWLRRHDREQHGAH